MLLENHVAGKLLQVTDERVCSLGQVGTILVNQIEFSGIYIGINLVNQKAALALLFPNHPVGNDGDAQTVDNAVTQRFGIVHAGDDIQILLGKPQLLQAG